VGLFASTRAHFWKLDEPPLYKTAYHFASTGQRAATSAFSFAGSFWVAAILVTFHWINTVVESWSLLFRFSVAHKRGPGISHQVVRAIKSCLYNCSHRSACQAITIF
jgi:hypothetical protein